MNNQIEKEIKQETIKERKRQINIQIKKEIKK